jgi:hypothetical protein
MDTQSGNEIWSDQCEQLERSREKNGVGCSAVSLFAVVLDLLLANAQYKLIHDQPVLLRSTTKLRHRRLRGQYNEEETLVSQLYGRAMRWIESHYSSGAPHRSVYHRMGYSTIVNGGSTIQCHGQQREPAEIKSADCSLDVRVAASHTPENAEKVILLPESEYIHGFSDGLREESCPEGDPDRGSEQDDEIRYGEPCPQGVGEPRILWEDHGDHAVD